MDPEFWSYLKLVNTLKKYLDQAFLSSQIPANRLNIYIYIVIWLIPLDSPHILGIVPM